MDEHKAESKQAFAPFTHEELGVYQEHPVAPSDGSQAYLGRGGSDFSDHGPVLTLRGLEGPLSAHVRRGGTGWMTWKPPGEHPGGTAGGVVRPSSMAVGQMAPSACESHVSRAMSAAEKDVRPNRDKPSLQMPKIKHGQREQEPEPCIFSSPRWGTARVSAMSGQP